MSATSIGSDKCAYVHDLSASMGPGQYMVNGDVREQSLLFSTNPHVKTTHRPAFAYGQEWVDVESDLTHRTKSLTHCPEKKHAPNRVPEALKRATAFQDTSVLHTEDTKLSNPPCTLKGKGINRWEWLCEDPQLSAIEPFDRLCGISNRNIAKDRHTPCIPSLTDQLQALPTENPHVQIGWVQDAAGGDGAAGEWWNKVDDRVKDPVFRSCTEMRKIMGV